jgi:flagellin-like hook-associated protein FlgL
METQQTAELSSIQDADITGAIIELTQAATHRQAALEARAQQPRQTLFDYLG